MGLLFDIAMADKRKTLIKELRLLGVNTSQDGVSLEELSFDELNYEFVQALFNRIDVECDSNKWF